MFTGFLLALLVLTLLPVGAGETERQVFNPQTCQGWDQSELAGRVDVPSRGPLSEFSTRNSASFSSRSSLTPDALNQANNALGCAGWTIPLNGFAPLVDRAGLTISLGAAARPHSEDVVVVRTSLDGQNWTTRSSIVIDNQYSNERNGGYTLVPLDDITSLDELRQLRVEVVPALTEDSATRLFVDHVGLSVDVTTTAHAKSKRLDPSSCVGWSNADQAKRINYRQNTPAKDFADRNVALIQRMADSSPSIGNTDQSSLTCETFGVLKATKGRTIIGATIVASLAARSSVPGADAVVLEYSLDDGATWQSGSTTVISGEDSNGSRGGYLTVPIVGGIDREGLAPLKVRVRYVAGEEPANAEVRVDGVGLEISTVPEPDRTASSLSFLARTSFLPLEEPVIVLEEGSLVGYEISDSSGRPVDIQADTKTSSRGVEVTVRRGRQIRPGTYTVKLKSKQGRRIVEETQTFTWGVASINTPKSTYVLGEAMPIVLGVVDVNGRTICDADLQLDVESPRGDRRSFSTSAGTISASATCGPKSITDAPDYLVRIVAEEAGLYRMKLTVQTADGPQSADLNVQVTAVRPFTIERVAPSRINPKQNYKIRLFAESDQSQEVDFVERLPEHMSVSDVSHGGTIEQRNGEQAITWKLKLIAGRESEVSYVVDAPDIAPALFTLGPAATETFSEPRQWQIASDEIIERRGREFAYESVRPAEDDWNQVQDNLIATVKPIYRPDEVAVVKVWTDGFADDSAPASPIDLSEVALRGPDGATVTLPSATESTTKSGRSRDVIYLAPNDGFRPGTYTASATRVGGDTVSASFEWGTLGIKFDRDQPKAKSLLRLNLVTRGTDGEVRCDDTLRLTISRPDGDQRVFDSRENTLTVCPNGQPTIEVDYSPSVAGRYNLELRRIRDGVERYVQQSMDVVGRNETPRNVKSDLDQAVAVKAASFSSKDQPRLRVKVVDSAAFGFLGVDSTSRTVTNIELIDPTGQRVAQSAQRSTEKQGGDTNELLDIDTSSFTKAGKYVARIDVEQGEYAETVEQDFTWGVLAVNVPRSYELPDHDTTIGMAVLDDAGTTLCDAELELEIRDPRNRKQTFSTRNGKISVSPECADKNYTNAPDYAARYRTGSVGTYTVKLTARTANGERMINDTFEVRKDSAFDIERVTYPMRIYPFVEYPVVVAITPRDNYRGPVTESLPEDFQILDRPDDVIETVENNRRLLTWNVDWTAGQRQELRYTIDFPDVSPEFYQVGKLKLDNFAEGRSWQIASDSLGSPTGTRLTTIGFELQSTTANVEYSANINTPVIDTTTYRSGAASLETLVTGSAATEGATYRYAAANSADDYYFRAYLNITTLPSTQTTIINFSDSTPSNQASIRMNTDGTLELWNEEDTAQVGSDSLALSTGRWYRLEMRVDNTTIASTVLDGRIDGQSFASGTVNHANGSYDVSVGIITTAATAEFNWDDLALNNDSTIDINWPGEGKVVHLRPNGTSANTCDAQANYHLLLDEITPNDATDTVLCDVNNDVVTVNVDDTTTAGIPAGSDIRLVHAGRRWTGVDATAAHAVTTRLTIPSSGTVESGTSTSSTTNTYFSNTAAVPYNYNQTIFDDSGPLNTGEISTTDLDSALVTFIATDAAPDSRVSTLWVVVEYTAPEGGRLYTSGFELQSVTTGVEWTLATGTTAIDTTTFRSGLASLEVASLASGTEESQATQFVKANNNGPFFFRAYLNITTAPSAENRIIEVKNAAGTTVVAYLTHDNTGTLKLYDEDGQITGTTTLSTATWYRIELKIDATGAGANDIVEARVDGVSFASSSTRDLSTGVSYFYIGGNLNAEAQTQGDWNFDDIAINQRGGIFQSDYPGEGKIVHMQPNATGDTGAWAVSVNCVAVDYTCIDEVTPNDATDAVATTTVNQIEDVNLESASSAGLGQNDMITVVQPNARWANSSTGQNDLRVRLKAAATSPVIEGVNIYTNSTSYATGQTGIITPSLTVYEKPYVNTPWTAADLDSAQIGIREMVDSANNLIVSTLWLQVEYISPTQGRIYSNGFELQSTTAGMEYSANVNTPTISTTTYRSGAAALRANPSSSTQGMEYEYNVIDSSSDTYFRSYVRFASLPAASTTLMAIRDNANTTQASIRFDQANSTLEVWNDEDSAQVGSDSAGTISTGTWYRLEMRVDFGTAATGDTTVEGKLDGTTIGTSSAVNWANGVRKIQLGIITTSTSADMFIDDVAINVNVGSTQNGYPGEGKIVHLDPNADGDTVGWTNTYTSIDDGTPNDGTDSITSSTFGQLEEANLESSTTAGIGTSDTISVVQTGVRFRNSSALGENSAFEVQLKDAASATNVNKSQPIRTWSQAWTSQSVEEATAAPRTLLPPQVTTKRPDGTNNWTPSQLDGTQIGVQLVYDGGSNTVDVTAMWVLVEYQAVATITVSGRCFTDHTEGTPCSNDGATTIKVAVNGTPDAGGAADESANPWTFSISQPAADAILVFYIDGETTESEEATSVVKYDGSGNVDLVRLYHSELVIGTDSGSANSDQTISNTDLATAGNGYENSDDEDVTYSVATGTLTVDDDNNKTETLYIISGDTYRPDSAGGDTVTTHHLYFEGTYTTDNNQTNVAGDFTNAGTFTSSTGTLTFNGTTAQTFTTNAAAYNAVTLNNTGTTGANDDVTISGALDVNGALNVTDGDLILNSGNPNVNTSAAVTIGTNALVTKGSGTWTFDGSGTSDLTDNAGTKQDLGTVTVDGTTKTLRLLSSAKMTNVTVGADDVLNLNTSSYDLELTGTGTPLTINGTFTPGTSTVTYSHATSATVTPTTYSGLQTNGAGTYTIGGTITDDFERASLGANWTSRVGTPTITGSSDYAGSSSGDNIAVYTGTTFGADQYAEATISGMSTGNEVQVCVRGDAAGNFDGYCLAAEPALFDINELTNGGWGGTVASGSIFPAVGDRIRLEIQGTALRAYINGRLVLTGTDATITTGSPGINVWASGTPTSTAEDFTGGTLTNVGTDITVTQGTLAIGNSSIVVNGGDISVSGTLTQSSNGVTTVVSTGSIGGGTTTFGNLIIGSDTSTQTTTAASNFTASGIHIRQSSGTNAFSASSRTLTLSRFGTPLVIDSTETFTASTSTMIFTGSGATTIPLTTFNNLEIKPGTAGAVHTATGGGTLTVGGYLTVGNGANTGTFNLDTNDPALDVAGDVTIATSGTLIGPSADTISIGGSFANSGVYTSNSGTILFDSTSSGKTISGNLTGTSAFGKPEFSGTGGGWTIQNSLDATDSFTVSDGTVTQAANTTLTVTGTEFTIAAAGVWVKTSGTGKIVLDNVTSLLFKDNSSPLQNMGVVQVGASPGTVTLGSDMSADSVTIPTGDTFNTKGYDVTTTGAFDCQGTCTLNLTDTAPDNETDGTIIDVGGDFTMSSSATFTSYSNSKIFMNSTAGTDTNRTFTTGGKSYNEVELKNAGGTNDDITISGSPLDVNSTLTLTDGQIRLDTNDPNVTTAGNLSIAAAASVTKADNGTATWTFDGTGTSTWTDNTASGGQDLGLVTINGTTKTVNLGSSAMATKLTIAASQTFGLGSSGYTFTLTGSGQSTSRPFQNSGTLNEGTNSTFKFMGTSTTDLYDDTFHHLMVAPPSGSPTFNFGIEGGAGTNVNGTLTVGDGTNAVTLNANNDETMIVHDVNIAASGTLIGNGITELTVSGSWLNNGTYDDNGGVVAFTSTSSGETLAGTLSGTSDLGTLVFSGTGGEWTNSSALSATSIVMTAGTFIGSNNVTVAGPVYGTAGVINRSGGTFEIRNSTSNSFGPTTASTAWTFNDLTFGNSHASTGITYTTQNCSSCTVTVSGVLRVGKSGDAAGATTTLTGATSTWNFTGTSADPFILLSSPAGAFTANTSTVNYNGVNGSGNVNIVSTNYSGLGCSPGSSEIANVAGSFTVSALLAIGTNCSFTIASSQTTTLSANTGTSITLNGTLTGSGRLTYQNSATTFPTSGTISGGILRFDMVNGSMTMPARTDYGAVEAYQNAGVARILTAGSAISQTLTMSSHLHVYADSAFNTTFEANTYDPTINIGGDIDFLGTGGGTEVLSVGAGTWTASGDVNLTDGSYSNATSNTLVMNGTGGKTLTPNNATLYNFTVDPSSSATINISTTNVGVTNNLVVADGDTLNINTTLDMDNTTTCSVNLNSTGTITSPAFAGTFWYGCSATFPSSGTVSNYWFIPNATNTDLTLPGRAFTGSPTTVWFYNAGASNRVITIGTAGGQTFSATANIRIYANSTGNLTVDASTNNPNFSTITDLDYVENSTGQATLITGSGTHTYSGSVSMTNGTYTASTGHTLVMTGTSKTLTTAGNSLYNFTVSSGSTTMSGTTTLNNDLTVSGGTLTAPASGALNVAGDFVNDATFVHNSSTLTLNGTTSTTLDTGCVTVTSCTNEDLYALVINKTAGVGANDDVTLTSTGVRVANTLTVTAGELVQGALNVQVDTGGSVSVGASGIWTNISTGDLYLGGGFDNAGSVTFSSSNAAQCTDVADDILIDSTVDNTLRTWSGAGTYTMRNVNVDDMSDGAITITIYTSTKSGDTDWTTGTCGIDVSGTIYQSGSEGTAYDCSGGNTVNLRAATNGGSNATGQCTAAGGTFTITGVSDPGGADVPMVVFIDSGDSTKATTVTLSASGGTNITGLTLIMDRVVVTQQSGTALTNAHMNTADNASAGIRYAVSAGNLTVESGMELHVLSGKVFTPGGTVTTTATGTAAGPAGDLHIAGTMTMGTNSLTVGGDYNNAGTLNKTNPQTTTLAATGTGFTITPGTGNLNNLTISGDAGGNGTYTLSGANLTVDGTLTVNTGDTLTIDTSRTLTNTGATDVNNDGTINGAGTLQFTSASGGPDSDANSTGTYSAVTRYNTTSGNIAAATFDARTYSGRVEIYQDNTTASNRSITPATDGTYTLTGSSSHLYLINDDAGQTLTLSGASASAVFTIGGDLDYTGTGASSEIIQSGNDVWTVAGNVDVRNGTYTATTGNELKMTGTASLYGNNQSFYKLTIDGSGTTVTAQESLTVTNALTIGGASDSNNDTFTLVALLFSTSSGSVVFGGSGTDTINGGGSLVVRNDTIDTDGVFGGNVIVRYDTYQGVAGLNVVARQYVNLAIDNYVGEVGETVTLGTAGGQTITVDNDLTIECSGCELGGSPNTVDGDSFDPTLNVTGSVVTYDPISGSHTISMGSGTWTIGGSFDLSFAGTFNHNSGTVIMNGTGTLTSNGKTLNNFTTNGTGTITLASATHTFAGNIVLGSSATLTPGTSTVVMNGTTKTIDGGGKTLYAFTVSGSTTTLQNTDLTVSNTLTISASQTLSINASRTLTHTGATLTWGNGSSTISGAGTLRFTDASGGPGTGGVISAVTRFDATNGNIASTTIDARTYSGTVEIYSNSTSARTVTLDSVAYVLSGASSHMYLIAANAADLIVAGDTNNPTVTIGGDLDFTGTGEGFEVLAAGTGTWTVSGNVNFTNGFYGPSVAVIAPTLTDTVERNRYYDAFAGCALNTQYYCLGSTQFGMTEDTDICIDSFQDRTENTDNMFMKFNPTGITDGVTILSAQVGVQVTAVYNQVVLVGRSSTDDLTCTSPSSTYTATTGSQYGTTDLSALGNKTISLGTTGVADVQSRLTGTTARLTVSLSSSSFDSSMGSLASSAARPALYVGYYASGSPTLVMNGASKTLTSAGNALYNLTLSGTITLANATHMVGNNLNITGGTITPGTSTVLMTGPAATLTGSGTGSLYALAIDPPSAGTVTLATGGNDLTVSNVLSVAAGDTLSLGADRTLTLSATTGGTLSLTGTISGSGRLTYKTSTAFPTTGIISSILRFDSTSTANQIISSRDYDGAVEIYNNSGGAKTVASSSGTMIFSTTLDLSVGSGSVTLDLNTTDPTTTTVTGGLTIGANATLSAPSTNAFNVNGNYINNGTFTDNGGTVTLAGTAQQDLSGTMTGSSDFNNVTVTNAFGDGSSTWSVTFAGNAAAAGTFTAATANTKLRFNAGSTYTFSGINFNGQATGTRVFLRSSTPGSLWYINAGNDTVLNTDVRDSDACASTGGAITPTDPSGTNFDSGNTICWDINQISFSISDLNIGFGTCVPGSARYATGDSLGASADSADAHTLTLSTNARTGYALTVFGSTLTSTAGTITGLGGSPTASSPGSEQFGLRAIKNSGAGTISSPFDTSNWAFNAAVTPQQIASHSGSASTTQIGVRYICNVSEVTEASSYSTDLTYVLTATF